MPVRWHERVFALGLLLSLTLSPATAQTDIDAPPAQIPAPPVSTGPNATAPDAAFVGDPNADPNTSVILENADIFEEHEAGRWTGKGNVRVRYKGYVLTSDQVDVDEDSGDALFSGHVTLKTPQGETVTGGSEGTLRLNLRDSTYVIVGANTTISPQELNIGMILPLFVYGGTVSGKPGLIDARGSRFTTCDFLEPHYAFLARQLYVFPGKRLVGKHVTLFRKNRPVITLPYFFVPLDQRFSRQTLAPQIGQTPDEGYFAKFAIGYALAAALPGILRIDALQKKGLGTGFDQTYGSSDSPQKGSGILTLYHLRDKSTSQDNVTGTLRHNQTFGTVGVSLNTQFQQNSYYVGAGKSDALSNQLSLTRNVGNLNLSLDTNLSANNYGSGRTQNLTSALNSSFAPTQFERLTSRFNFSHFKTGGIGASSTPDQLQTNLDYAQTGKRIDLEVIETKYTSLGHATTGTNYFGGLEQLPELRVGTDVLRESALRAFLPSTARLNFSLGEFNEPSSNTHGQRAQLGMDLGQIVKNLNKRNTFNLGGSFSQAFYSDNAAQYVLNGRTGYQLQIGHKSNVNLNYNYLRPYGFTPYQFDFIGNSNTASLAATVQETPQFRLSLGTGYDFNAAHAQNGFSAAPWQNISFQSVYTPNDVFRLRTNTAYDINHGQLLDLTNYFRIRVPRGLSLDVGTRYSPQQKRFSNINGNIDLPFARDPNPAEDAGWRLRAIGGYNGYTSKFEYKGLAVTRSWHDYEATLIYQDDPSGIRPGSTVTLNFRLKAFPDYEPFAVGQFGQSLDTGLGDVY